MVRPLQSVGYAEYSEAESRFNRGEYKYSVICLLWKQDETEVHVSHVFNIPGLEGSGDLPSFITL